MNRHVALGLYESFVAALLVVLGAVVILVLVTLLRRLSRVLQERRRERLAARFRPLLIEVLASEDVEPEALERLAALTSAHWKVLEPSVVAMLSKIRGDARDRLVQLLRNRGVLDKVDRATRSWSAVNRCRAAEVLGAVRRRPGVPLLVRLLDDRNADVRRVATRSLGRIGDATAVPALLTAAAESKVPAREVASVLVLVEPAATPILIARGGETSSANIRAMVAEVLGLRGAVEATGLLVSLLAEDLSPEVRIRAARALGRIGSPGALDALVAAVRSDDVALRAVSVKAIGDLGSTAGCAILGELLDDPDHRVCANAAEALLGLGEPGRRTLEEIRHGGAERPAAYAAEALALARLDEQGANGAEADHRRDGRHRADLGLPDAARPGMPRHRGDQVAARESHGR